MDPLRGPVEIRVEALSKSLNYKQAREPRCEIKIRAVPFSSECSLTKMDTMNRLLLERRCNSLRSEAQCGWFPACAWDEYGCYWRPACEDKAESESVPSNGTGPSSSPLDLCAGLTPSLFCELFFFMYFLCAFLEHLVRKYGRSVIRYVVSGFPPAKSEGGALGDPDILEAQKLPSS